MKKKGLVIRLFITSMHFGRPLTVPGSDEVSKITPNKQFNATFDLPCIVIKSFQLFSTRTIPAEQNLLKKIQSSTPRDVDEV